MNAVNARGRLPSPEMRAGIFYTTMFGSAGVAGAYFAIWLSDKGLSSGDIGIINSLPVFFMLALNLVVGRIADRANDWRTVIVIGAILSGLIPFALFAVDGFWGILIVWTLGSIPFAAVAPVADAATVRLTRRRGSDFAKIRAWGTVGYMLALAVTGYIASLFGPGAFVVTLVAVCLARAAASLALPRFRATEGEHTMPVALAARRIGEALKPWFLLPILAFAIVEGTLMLLNAFGALVWKQAGIPPEVIGPLLALGALSEVVTMFLFTRLARRVTARNLILVSTLVSAVRWAVMAFDPPLAVLVVLQMTHGICFGFGYLGVVNFIANWTSEDVAAEAQSLAVVTQQGMSVIAMFGFGYLMQAFDARAFLFAAAACVLAALAVAMSLRLRSSAAERESGA